MAYNRRNLLLKVKEVCEIYRRESGQGRSNEYIYLHFIKDRYHISRTTFYQFLTIPYERELKKVDEKLAVENCQLKMFE